MAHPSLLTNPVGNPSANVAPPQQQVPYQQQVANTQPVQMQPQHQPSQDPDLVGWPTNEQVLQTWSGPNGIAQLNQYTVQLENHVGEQEQVIQQQHETLQSLEPHMHRYEALEGVVFDPDQLAEYASWAFGSEGPWPVQQQQQLPVAQMQYDQMGNPLGYVPPMNPVQDPQYNLPPGYQPQVPDQYQQMLAPQMGQMPPQGQVDSYAQMQGQPNPYGAPMGPVPGQNAVNPNVSIQQHDAEMARLAQERDQYLAAQQAFGNPVGRPNFPGGYANQGGNLNPADLLGQTLSIDPSRTPDLVTQLFNSGAFMNTNLVHQ